MAVVMWGYVGAKMRDIWMRWRSMWWAKPAGEKKQQQRSSFVRGRRFRERALCGFVVHCFDSFAEISNRIFEVSHHLHLSFAYASSRFVPSDHM